MVSGVNCIGRNRFLDRERFNPEDLFKEVKEQINLVGGILSVDDSVLDKPYSVPKNSAFIDWFWSGKHKAVVKGINLVTLFYTDINGYSVSVNYRIRYDLLLMSSLGGAEPNEFGKLYVELSDGVLSYKVLNSTATVLQGQICADDQDFDGFTIPEQLDLNSDYFKKRLLNITLKRGHTPQKELMTYYIYLTFLLIGYESLLYFF